MLLRFTVSNFLSFAEEVEFNMFPSNLKIHKDHVYNLGNGVDVLKAAAIYGANGSGKSNFVKAAMTLREIVRSRYLLTKKVSFKLDEEYEKFPTKFEVEFKTNSRFFIFGISFFENWIQKEWLYESFPNKNKQELIYEREKVSFESKNKISVNKVYLKDEKEKLRFEIYEEELFAAELFLGRFFKISMDANWVVIWFLRHFIIVNFSEKNELGRLSFLYDYLGSQKYIGETINKLSTGISKIEFKKVQLNQINDVKLQNEILRKFTSDSLPYEFVFDNEEYFATKINEVIEIKKLVVYNRGKNNVHYELGFYEQSEGTKTILRFLPFLERLDNIEGTIFIDEIELNLHPTMIKELLAYFMSRPTKGQLIFTTHESHLLDLDIFRQDEIWFTEKNEEGATRMYPLSDFKPRYDLDIQKGYLAGRFGAIPFIGNLKDLISTDEKI